MPDRDEELLGGAGEPDLRALHCRGVIYLRERVRREGSLRRTFYRETRGSKAATGPKKRGRGLLPSSTAARTPLNPPTAPQRRRWQCAGGE
jgi:hypothetical protein